MQPRFAFKSVLASLAVAAMSVLPVVPVQASAAAVSAQLDEAVAQRLQTTPESGLIPVIVEGAASGVDSPARADQADRRVRNTPAADADGPECDRIGHKDRRHRYRILSPSVL